MKILVIRFSSLGDIVLTSGFCSWIKENYPDTELHFLTLEENQQLVSELPFIDQVFTYKKQSGLNDIKQLLKLSHSLRSNDYRFIVDLHGNTRSFLLRNFLYKFPALVLDKWRFERNLLIKFQKDYLTKAPAQFERAMHDFAFTLQSHWEKEEFFQIQKKQGLQNITTSLASLVKEQKEKSFTICPGASFETKKYPVKYFAQIASEVLSALPEYKLNILGAPHEKECTELAQALVGFEARVENLQGKMKLSESIKFIATTQLVLGNDSLFGHIADSINIPALSIFGPTDERFGFAPYGVHSKTYSVKNLSCRPCSLTGNKKCIRTNQFCMDNINRQMIIRDIIKRLEGAK